MSSSSASPRILMFPWLGFGHITAYLELAKKLTTKGFFVYLCSTPATLTSIEKRITSDEKKSIELVPLVLNVSPEELPPHLHTTNGLPPHLMVKLKEAFDNSKQNLSAILENLKPDLLIFDFLQPWAPSVADALNLNIQSVIFITSSSVMTSFMFHHFKNQEHATNSPFPYTNIRFRDYESRFMEELLHNSADPTEREKYSLGFNKSKDIVLITGSGEIEGNHYSRYASGLVGKEFVPVGPLVREPTSEDDGGDHDVLSWLDKKEAKSTVFVSFGSEFFLSEADMEQIARGLLLTDVNVNLIWVVRFPKGADGKISATASLPQGFVKGVGDRGKILYGWAPQTKILAHPSVGGFVSHCGWNSVMESTRYGVPIIAMPMHLDQPINARLVEEIGVGMEVLRESDGKLVGETLAAVINRVVMEPQGGVVRQKAAAIKAKIEANGDRDIDYVAEKLNNVIFAKEIN